jgi:hypothetical protein
MSKSPEGQSYFYEEQRFRQPWLIILVVGLAGLSWYAFITQVIYKKTFGDNPAPDVVVWIIWAIFGLVFPLFFLSLRMTTDLVSDGLRIRFFPFYRRSIPLDEIKSFEVREYSPLREYGGWGVRFSPKHGTAYNVSGNRGVQLVLMSGKRVLIGSQEPERLANALRNFVPGG